MEEFQHSRRDRVNFFLAGKSQNFNFRFDMPASGIKILNFSP